MAWPETKADFEYLEFSKWRDVEKAKHRVMTAAEYAGWRQSGDAISSPIESNPFPGGLTITFGPGSSVMGQTEVRRPSQEK